MESTGTKNTDMENRGPFKDTVSFRLKNHLGDAARDETLESIRNLPSVAGIFKQGAEYGVEMTDNADHVLVGVQISRRKGVESTRITPAHFHSLIARHN